MFLQVTLRDFIDPVSYFELQNKFQMQDERNFSAESLKEIVMEDIKIVYKTYDENNVEQYHNKSFYYDFLLPNAGQIADNYIRNFQNEIQKKFQYNPDERKEFIKLENKAIFEMAKQLENVSFYSEEILATVREQFNILSDFLVEAALSQVYENDLKIKVNLSQTELLLFFHLLRESKVIPYVADSELGLLVTKTFQVLKESEFANINDARKHINSFKNGAKTVDTALETLKNIFSHENFYSIRG